jgi:hypothetical protein
MATALAAVDRHADALVLVLLDGLDLALAHRDRQPATLADLDRRIAGARFLGNGKHVLCKLLELILGMGEDGIGHVRFS